jgi:hypothetical protein
VYHGLDDGESIADCRSPIERFIQRLSDIGRLTILRLRIGALIRVAEGSSIGPPGSPIWDPQATNASIKEYRHRSIRNRQMNRRSGNQQSAMDTPPFPRAGLFHRHRFALWCRHVRPAQFL